MQAKGDDFETPTSHKITMDQISASGHELERTTMNTDNICASSALYYGNMGSVLI